MFQYIAALATIFLVYKLGKYLKWRREVCYHLEKIGGPKAYPLIGNLYMFYGIKKRSDVLKLFIKILSEQPPLFRTYNGLRPEVCITKPKHVEQILTSSVNIKKGTVYQVLKQWLGDGLLISEGAKWHQRRKMITPTFHFQILEHFMHVFIEKSKLLVDHLEEKSSGEAFDIFPYITHCTLDIICETAMGVKINAMSDMNSSYVRAIYGTSELIIKKQMSIIEQTPLYPYTKNGKEFYKNLDIMHNFTDKVIAERRKMLKDNPIKMDEDDLSMSTKKRPSFLDLLLSASQTLTDEDIRAEVDTFMFEGHDTTTAGICWTMYLLGLNQDAQETAFQEIKSLLGDGKAPESISELNELKYLECCIKESLRLFPSVPMIGRMLIEDVMLDDYKIPKGVDANISIYQVHRNAEIYPDPEKFDPDRFLPENCKGRHPYAYIPFSAGPRNCVGQKFAMYEEKTLLATILRSYKIIPIDTPETLNWVSELVLRPEDGLNIALEKRKD